jgi:hypothetical protein
VGTFFDDIFLEALNFVALKIANMDINDSLWLRAAKVMLSSYHSMLRVCIIKCNVFFWRKERNWCGARGKAHVEVPEMW